MCANSGRKAFLIHEVSILGYFIVNVRKKNLQEKT